MYADLFDHLGARDRPRTARSDSPPVIEPLVALKAGQMALTASDHGTYECVPDFGRGEIRLVWKDAALQWEWYNRRERKVEETFLIDGDTATFERVPLNDKVHENDRIYVLDRTGRGDYRMYWMQAADAGDEDELVAKVNQYLSDPMSARPASEAPAAPAAAGASTAPSAQVDALSSILENLGMPQNGDSSSSSSSLAAASPAPATGTLTLADLQGAMAGVAQQQAPPGPSLSEVVTPSAVTDLLEDEAVVERLLQLLPEEQRTHEALEENLRSPQVQATFRTLTAALLPDDSGNMDGFYSLIANFQLDPEDGHAALAAGNPIQAFLDCLLKSVEKKADESKEE